MKQTIQENGGGNEHRNNSKPLFVPLRIKTLLICYYVVLSGYAMSLGGIGYLRPGGITLALGIIAASITAFILDRKNVISVPWKFNLFITLFTVFIATSLYYVIDSP